jgi:hypothetical protein
LSEIRILDTVSKLKRKNQDLFLFETIKKVGMQNYSLLSRLTGLDPETVRYRVNYHLKRFGLSACININYSQLGLLVSLIITEGTHSENAIPYLSFHSRAVGSNKNVFVIVHPARLKKKYINYLEQRAKDFRILKVKIFYWVRMPSFRIELFNFDKRTWEIDWNKIELPQPEEGPSFISYNPDAKPDYFDLKILKKMVYEPSISIAKIAKELNVNPRTLRYHYLEHVLKQKLILSHNLKIMDSSQKEEKFRVSILVENLEEKSLEEIRGFCNRLPFTWLEARTEDRNYFAIMDIPLQFFNETLKRLELRLRPLSKSYEVMLLDPSTPAVLDIPDSMFDPDRGWRLYEYNQIKEEVMKE